MKRYVSMFLLIIICFLLQTTIFRFLQLANVIPNLLLILTAVSGFMYGRRLGMFSGVLCGLLMDLLYGNVIGLCILILVLIGYVNGIANKFYFKDDMVIPLLAIALSDLVYGFLYYSCNFLLRGRLNLFFYLKSVMIPEMVYTVLLGIILYKLIHWLDEKLNPPVEVPLEKSKPFEG